MSTKKKWAIGLFIYQGIAIIGNIIGEGYFYIPNIAALLGFFLPTIIAIILLYKDYIDGKNSLSSTSCSTSELVKGKEHLDNQNQLDLKINNNDDIEEDILLIKNTSTNKSKPISNQNEENILKIQNNDVIKYCRKCGLKLRKNSMFCNKCGTKIKEEE